MSQLTYTEYPNSDRPIEINPIELESPVYRGQAAHRLTTQLLRWAAPKMVEFANKGGDLSQWTNCLGCDCAFLTEAVNGVFKKDRWLDRVDEREIVDVIIYVDDRGWTKLQPIYDGEQPDRHMPNYEIHDWIIICRPFEQSLGHGMRWFEISDEQAFQLLDLWARKHQHGRWRPRITSCGDAKEAVFLTNLTEPIALHPPEGAKDYLVISRHSHGANTPTLERWFRRLRDLSDRGEQERLKQIADALEVGHSRERVEYLLFHEIPVSS